jgi:hypothetical protein
MEFGIWNSEFGVEKKARRSLREKHGRRYGVFAAARSPSMNAAIAFQ